MRCTVLRPRKNLEKLVFFFVVVVVDVMDDVVDVVEVVDVVDDVDPLVVEWDSLDGPITKEKHLKFPTCNNLIKIPQIRSFSHY